jgi:hypothetical protein
VEHQDSLGVEVVGLVIHHEVRDGAFFHNRDRGVADLLLEAFDEVVVEVELLLGGFYHRWVVNRK